jgi:probable phosphoglycerate mutase
MAAPDLLHQGEAEWNAVRRFQGHGDSPLTAQGRTQAEQYAAALERANAADKFRLVSSPLGRAAVAAQIIGSRLGHARRVR